MNLQINLLKKSEQRYQGIVSMKVIVLGSAALLIGILALFFLLSGIHKVTLMAHLERTRREWARLEPGSQVVRRQSDAARANRRAYKNVQGWAKRTGAPLYKIMRELQRSVPVQVQVFRLEAGVFPSLKNGNPECSLQLNGRAEGTGGEMLAVELKRNLNGSSEVRSFCNEVRLVSSQRETGDAWVFSMEGRREIGDAP